MDSFTDREKRAGLQDHGSMDRDPGMTPEEIAAFLARIKENDRLLDALLDAEDMRAWGDHTMDKRSSP